MLNDSDFSQLLRVLDRPWKGYRKVRKGVMKRIRRHMRRLACTDIEEYLALIQGNADEYSTCQALLRVTISRFFRDRLVWENIQENILPRLLANFPDKIRIWSAGCAGGEEPYSMAILWSELKPMTTLELIASDADQNSILRAQSAIYGRSSLKEVSPQLIKRYFAHSETDDTYQVDSAAKEAIIWHQHDLLDSPLGHGFHIIFLRNNLLTYYDEPMLSVALKQLLTALVPGGYLIVGSHETLPTEEWLRGRYTKLYPCIFQIK